MPGDDATILTISLGFNALQDILLKIKQLGSEEKVKGLKKLEKASSASSKCKLDFELWFFLVAAWWFLSIFAFPSTNTNFSVKTSWNSAKKQPVLLRQFLRLVQAEVCPPLHPPRRCQTSWLLWFPKLTQRLRDKIALRNCSGLDCTQLTFLDIVSLPFFAFFIPVVSIFNFLRARTLIDLRHAFEKQLAKHQAVARSRDKGSLQNEKWVLSWLLTKR